MNHTLCFHYDFEPRAILEAPDAARRMDLMWAAGVRTVWLDCYTYGTWLATKDEILRAKAMLEQYGFEVQALTVPVGHGGGALLGDAGDPGLPRTWQNRINAQGQSVALASCIRNEAMLQESREVAEQLYDLGFTKLFYDDDLRVGPWGPALQGCCCERCMQAFYQKYPQYTHMTAPEIFAAANEGDDLWNAWSDVQCDAVLHFLERTVPDGMTPGIMIMHNGDARHGVDIARIKARFPNALFRVGEGHFEDASFTHPLGHAAICRSVCAHLHAIGSVQNAYSESTVYPENALSPEYLVQKLELEIACGLRNLFLMSGLFFLDDAYWLSIAQALPALQVLAQDLPIPELSDTPDPVVWQL